MMMVLSHGLSRILAEDEDDYRSANTAFIVAGALIGFVVVVACCIPCVLHRVAAIQADRRQEGDQRRAHYQKDGSKIFDLLKDIFRASIYFRFPIIYALLLGGVQLNFDVTCLVVLIFMIVYSSFRAVGMAYVAYGLAGSRDEILGGRPPGGENDANARASNYVRVAFSFQAENIYQDFRRPFYEVFMIGTAQLILTSMFLWAVYEAGRPDFSNPRIYTFYWLGVVVQTGYLVSIDYWKKVDQPYRFWASAFFAMNRNLKITCEKEESAVFQVVRFVDTSENAEEQITLSCLQLLPCCLVAIAVNVTGFSLIMLGLPLFLASSDEPFDFVLNAVAAYYIVDLDDYGSPLEYHVEQDDMTACRKLMYDWLHGKT